MFKKEIISSILALGLVTLNVNVSNANTRIKQLELPSLNVVLGDEILTDKTTTYSFGKWVNESGLWYYYVNGVKETGWKLIDGNWYYLEQNGAMVTGWKLIDGNWYYLEQSGAMATGWKLISNNWYYLEQNGAMVTGWKLIDGNWYYLEESGAMATGWKLISNNWYYLEQNGVMVTGWKLIDGNWYYLEESGAMATGWKLISNNWYYLEQNGAMVTGWKLIDGNWYYLEESGAMATGWRLINNNWYYMYGSGIMATNTIIDGWKIDANGVAKKNSEVQNHAPTVTADSVTINQGEHFDYSMLNAKTTDKDGDKVTITYDGVVKPSEPGKYDITVIATDEHGAKGTVKVTVTVEKKAQQGITDPNSSEFQTMVANEMYALVNAHRRANGVQDAVILDRLGAMAHYKSQHMADNNYFDHTYNGQFVWQMTDQFGEASGENIALNNMNDLIEDGVLDAQDAKTLANRLFNQWKKSPGHNNAMLDEWSKSIGFGFYVKVDSHGNYSVYATQNFYGLTKSIQEPEELGKEEVKDEQVPVEAPQEEQQTPQVKMEDTVTEPTVEM